VCRDIYGIKKFVLGCRKRVLGACIRVQEEFVQELQLKITEKSKRYRRREENDEVFSARKSA